MKRILIIPLLSVFVLLVFVKSGLALTPQGSRGTLKGVIMAVGVAAVVVLPPDAARRAQSA